MNVSPQQSEARSSYELLRASTTNTWLGGMMSKLKGSKHELVVQEMPTRGSFLNLVGMPFGRLTVARYAGKLGTHQMWDCVCECGGQVVTSTNALNRGNTKSCGCLRKQITATQGRLNSTHGQATHGAQSITYRLWRGLKNRAVNGLNHDKRYSRNGIGMYPEWVDDFVAFDTWITANLGIRPEGYQLDRINNDGWYEPGNLRWATRSEQARNRRNTWKTSFMGEVTPVVCLCEIFGLAYDTVLKRVKTQGWTLADALATPVGKKRPPSTTPLGQAAPLLTP